MNLSLSIKKEDNKPEKIVSFLNKEVRTFLKTVPYCLNVLGSKTLGLNVLELHFVILANHDQNV